MCGPAREYKNPGSHRYKKNTHAPMGSTPQMSQELTNNIGDNSDIEPLVVHAFREA